MTNRIIIAITDTAAKAREMYGDAVEKITGVPQPDHAWQFEVFYSADRQLTTGTDVMDDERGGCITFNPAATAAHIVDHLRQEGLLPEGGGSDG